MVRLAAKCRSDVRIDLKQRAFMWLGVADQGGDFVGGEECIGEDAGTGDGQGGYCRGGGSEDVEVGKEGRHSEL